MLISTLRDPGCLHCRTLALVFLPENPNSNTITQTQKQIIAQEFNFSETIFIQQQWPSLDKGNCYFRLDARACLY